jgi:hypothetical protein
MLNSLLRQFEPHLISDVGKQGEVNLGFFLEKSFLRKSFNEADTLCKPHIKLYQNSGIQKNRCSLNECNKRYHIHS